MPCLENYKICEGIRCYGMVHFYGNEYVGAGADFILYLYHGNRLWNMQKNATNEYGIFDYILCSDLFLHMASQRGPIYGKCTSAFYAFWKIYGRTQKKQDADSSSFRHDDDDIHDWFLPMETDYVKPIENALFL